MKHNINIGDEVVVGARLYIVEEIKDGIFYGVGDDGEEVEGNLDSVDCHFPKNETWNCF